MLEVKYSTNKKTNALSLSCIGHAGEAGSAECAAASMIICLAAQIVQEANQHNKFIYPPAIKLDAGDSGIRCVCTNKAYKSMKSVFDYTYTGFLMLAGKYPDKVSAFKEDTSF